MKWLSCAFSWDDQNNSVKKLFGDRFPGDDVLDIRLMEGYFANDLHKAEMNVGNPLLRRRHRMDLSVQFKSLTLKNPLLVSAGEHGRNGD
ncbi:MAG: hypothetical protein WCO14_04565, partial [bacterium]